MVTVLPPEGDQPDQARSRMSSRRLVAGVVVFLAVVAVAAIGWSIGSRTNLTAVPVGQASDFPTGSVTEVDLNVGHYDPYGVEGPSEESTAGQEHATTRLLIVNVPDQGLFALSDRSPWLGCRVVEVTAESVGDFGGTVPADFEHGFRDPCHGGLYSLDGLHLDGPGERGLDRFPVGYLPDGSVVVDLTKLTRTQTAIVPNPQSAALPDVTGLLLGDAQRELLAVGADPVVSDGESQSPDSLVWAQEPNDGGSYSPGTIVGLRTCQPADQLITTHRARLESTGLLLTDAWMTRSLDSNLESWYFVSAHVSGSARDPEIATWAIPGFSGESDMVNTPNLSIPANAVSQDFDFGLRRFSPEDYGVSDWLDLAGAIESQRCVQASQTRE